MQRGLADVDNPGNLCGLVGFFITSLIGFIAGGVFGVWLVAKPNVHRPNSAG
jgi:hypothetical protein